MVAKLNFSVSFKPVGFGKGLEQKIRDAIDSELLTAADALQAGSPVATGKLKASWDVEPTKFEGGSVLVGRITNNAKASVFRVRGRDAGKMPPLTPIRVWLRAVGGDPDAAFPIARAIAKKGTRRFRGGADANVAKIDKAGNLLPSSPISRAQRNISQKFKKIKL